MKTTLKLTWAIMAHARVMTSYQSPCGIGLRLFLNIDMNPLIVLVFLDTAQQHTVHGCTMYCVNNAIEARRHDL